MSRGRPRKVQPMPQLAPTMPPDPAPPMPWDGASDDFVSDVLRLVFDMTPGLSAEIVTTVDRQIRERWGGDRPYIARRAGAGRSERNAAIRRDFARGERLGLLSRRYNLTERQLMNILHGNPLP